MATTRSTTTASARTGMWTTNVGEQHVSGGRARERASERRDSRRRGSGLLVALSDVLRVRSALRRQSGAVRVGDAHQAVPFALGWLVRPFVTGIPRDTIAFTLGQVRGALVKSAVGRFVAVPRVSHAARVACSASDATARSHQWNSGAEQRARRSDGFSPLSGRRRRVIRGADADECDA